MYDSFSDECPDLRQSVVDGEIAFPGVSFSYSFFFSKSSVYIIVICDFSGVCTCMCI